MGLETDGVVGTGEGTGTGKMDVGPVNFFVFFVVQFSPVFGNVLFYRGAFFLEGGGRGYGATSGRDYSDQGCRGNVCTRVFAYYFSGKYIFGDGGAVDICSNCRVFDKIVNWLGIGFGADLLAWVGGLFLDINFRYFGIVNYTIGIDLITLLFGGFRAFFGVTSSVIFFVLNRVGNVRVVFDDDGVFDEGERFPAIAASGLVTFGDFSGLFFVFIWANNNVGYGAG